jgi:maleylacetate reductase
MSRVLRFGPGSLGQLAEVLREVGVERAVLVSSRRGARAAGELPVCAVFDGVRAHVPVETVEAAAALAADVRADGLVGLGGGAAIDTCKAAAARLHETDLVTDRYKVVAVPTTYAGAEWTPFFGVLLGPGRKGGGADEHARPVAAIYDAMLTLELPVAESVGTAMNALAHCAEAFYHPATSATATAHAARGARAIGEALPLVASHPGDLDPRTRLLEGAMHAALALAESGLCLGHAMAQGLGGRFGLAQGAMNAICLPAALRFNAKAVPRAVRAFADALGVSDAAVRCEELAALGGFPLRLRDHGVAGDELATVAEAIAARPGARANPRPASPTEIEGLLRTLW